MKNEQMRILKRAMVAVGVILVAGGALGAGCIEDRLVDIVAGGEITVPLQARGTTNVFGDPIVIDLTGATGADIQQIISENGFEEGSTRAVLESISYRVTSPDPTQTRTINGTITIAPQGGAAEPLVSLGSIAVDDPANQSWVSVPLTQAGTTIVNTALANYLQNNIPAVLTLEINGTSEPANVSTNFDWELKIVLSIAGKKKLQVINPL